MTIERRKSSEFCFSVMKLLHNIETSVTITFRIIGRLSKTSKTTGKKIILSSSNQVFASVNPVLNHLNNVIFVVLIVSLVMQQEIHVL
jgi:hypothetical protein